MTCGAALSVAGSGRRHDERPPAAARPAPRSPGRRRPPPAHRRAAARLRQGALRGDAAEGEGPAPPLRPGTGGEGGGGGARPALLAAGGASGAGAGRSSARTVPRRSGRQPLLQRVPAPVGRRRVPLPWPAAERWAEPRPRTCRPLPAVAHHGAAWVGEDPWIAESNREPHAAESTANPCP